MKKWHYYEADRLSMSIFLLLVPLSVNMVAVLLFPLTENALEAARAEPFLELCLVSSTYTLSSF